MHWAVAARPRSAGPFSAYAALTLCSRAVTELRKTRKLTQQDPIGVAGGSNLYGFASGDPVNFSDPYGLSPDCMTLPMPCPVIVGGLAGAGPLGWFALAVGAVTLADRAFASETGSVGFDRAAPADATAFNRRSGRTLKKEWEAIHGVPWPAGCVAHHCVPLADGGVDAGINIKPLTPGEHTEHHQKQGDFKRWGQRSKKPKEEKNPDGPDPKR